MRRLPYIFTLLAAVMIYAGCGRHSDHESVFRRAYSLLDSDPHRALAILDSVAATTLGAGIDSARYITLHALAEDKANSLVTSDSIMQVAIRTLQNEPGETDCLRRALYMQGRILAEQQRDAEAVVALLKAENLIIPSTPELEKGLIYHQLSESCNAALDGREAISYAKKAHEAYLKADRPLHAAYALTLIGVEHNNIGEYAEAIPYFREAIDSARAWGRPGLLHEGADGMARSLYGIDDVGGSLEYFRILAQDSAFADDKAISLWLDAESQCGDKALADSVSRRLLSRGNVWVADVVAGSDISNDQLQKAYTSQVDSITDMVYDAYRSTLAASVRENAEMQKRLLHQKVMNQRIVFLLCVLLIGLVATGAVIFYRHKKKLHMLEIEQYEREMQDLRDAAKGWEEISRGHEHHLLSLIEQYTSAVNSAERGWENMENAENPTKTQKKLINAIKSVVDKARNDPEAMAEIAELVNLRYDGIANRLAEEMTMLTENERNMFLLMAFGFSSFMIRRFLDLRSINEYYVMKTRLKAKFKGAAPPSLDSFLFIFNKDASRDA